MNSEPTPSHHTEPSHPPDPDHDAEISDAQSVDSHNSVDAIASEYGKSPRQMTRAAWMKELIEKHKGWIGFEGMGSHIQALDYRAGTELISQALAPHVHEIIAVVDAKNMVIEYNKIALQTKDDNPDCEMRAVWGDLVEGKEPVDEAWAADEKFDIIAMSTHGLGSKHVASALKGLGMEDVMVTEGKDVRLRYENVDDGEPEMAGEVYYLLKAKKRVAYGEVDKSFLAGMKATAHTQESSNKL